jgi:PHD/YefM family antitoxin component YafN of YafNO toxin-antitoxin module
MQRSLSELSALPRDQLLALFNESGEPILVTENGELRFVAIAPDHFDSMVRRLRLLEPKRSNRAISAMSDPIDRNGKKGKVIPLRP